MLSWCTLGLFCHTRDFAFALALFRYSGAECDGTQNFFRYRDRYFFPGPIFSGTGTGTFFRDQIFPVPVPVLFSGTNFFRYRYRYLQKGAKFPGPRIPGTGMSHSAIWHVVCAMEAVFSTSDPTVANHGCNSFRISLNFHKTSIQHIQYSLVVGTKFVYWIPSQVSELDTC